MPPKIISSWDHTLLQRFLEKILVTNFRLTRGLANRFLDTNFSNPRTYSNVVLKHYAPFFSGDVINVSGASDTDYRGGFYKDYFTNAQTYSISNAATADKGLGSVVDKSINEIELDLNVLIDESLKRKYDVVFNHTTLEHVFELHTAFKNLCDMSRDAVIIVVPVIQQIHIRESFGDYNRPTTMLLAKLFKDNGFTPLVMSTNNQPFAPLYCFTIGVRDEAKYKDKIESYLNFRMGDELYGGKLDPAMVGRIIS